MLSFRNRAEALALQLPPNLHALVTLHIDHATVFVIEPGDTEEDIVRETGLSPLVNPTSGARFDSALFFPFWESFGRWGGWFELVIRIADGSFVVLLIGPARTDDLSHLCLTNAD